MDRRRFLDILSAISLTGAGIMGFLGSMRLIYPDTARSETIYRIGRVDDYPVHTFTFVKDKNIYVYRDRSGIKVVSARCTHLGCILQKNSNGFRCPCHGSNYDRSGMVLSGPAPRGLDWLRTEYAHDGRLLVWPHKRVSADFLLPVK